MTQHAVKQTQHLNLSNSLVLLGCCEYKQESNETRDITVNTHTHTRAQYGRVSLISALLPHSKSNAKTTDMLRHVWKHMRVVSFSTYTLQPHVRGLTLILLYVCVVPQIMIIKEEVVVGATTSSTTTLYFLS